MIRRAFVAIGNRGVVLGLLGAIWILTAIGVAVEPVKTPGVFFAEMPVQVQFVSWFIPGFIALVASGIRRLDVWAWTVLMIPITIRFFSYLAGWILNTYPLGWRGAAIYAATGLLVNRCAAGLDRPPPWDGRDRREWMIVRP